MVQGRDGESGKQDTVAVPLANLLESSVSPPGFQQGAALLSYCSSAPMVLLKDFSETICLLDVKMTNLF